MQWEREHEKQLRADAEAKRAAAAAEEEAARAAAIAATAARLAALEASGAEAGAVSTAPAGGDDIGDGSGRKRRRKVVDYAELNRKLEQEEAGRGERAA